ncbi:MAG: class I SAM-dependent methyltransferase [Enhygromyxa sp.]
MARSGARGRRERERELAELLDRGTHEHYLDPILYDFEYADQEDDVDWYGALADERGAGKTVLELGAGSGRISIPIAMAGHRLIALDRMPAMLDHLFAKLDALAKAGEPVTGEVTRLVAEMTEIPLPDASVGLVIAPFNVLMHLYGWRELLACFREVHRLLEPGGSFAFDVLLPDLEWLRWDPNERHAMTHFEHPRTGQKLIYSTNHEYDPETQICHIRIYYDDARAGGRPGGRPLKTVHLAHRQIFPEEVRMLAGVVGFEIESHTGDFLDLSLNKDVEVQVVLCRKRGE